MSKPGSAECAHDRKEAVAAAAIADPSPQLPEQQTCDAPTYKDKGHVVGKEKSG